MAFSYVVTLLAIRSRQRGCPVGTACARVSFTVALHHEYLLPDCVLDIIREASNASVQSLPNSFNLNTTGKE